jgi:hypothetical protein
MLATHCDSVRLEDVRFAYFFHVQGLHPDDPDHNKHIGVQTAFASVNTKAQDKAVQGELDVPPLTVEHRIQKWCQKVLAPPIEDAKWHHDLPNSKKITTQEMADGLPELIR